jgi:hypothetical protein
LWADRGEKDFTGLERENGEKNTEKKLFSLSLRHEKTFFSVVHRKEKVESGLSVTLMRNLLFDEAEILVFSLLNDERKSN